MRQHHKSFIGTAIGSLIMILTFTACQDNKGATPITGRAPQIAGGVVAPTGRTVTLNGWVVSQESYQQAFQDTVSGFVEAELAPEYLGFVSATGQGGTGFFIGGDVPLQTGILNTTNNPQVNIQSGSYLLVGIYDEFANRPDATGKVVGPYGREFKAASGYVQGNRAYIKFTNQFGMVEMNGTFDAQVFQGSFHYENLMRWDKSTPGAAGDIGTFQVPTCQFFRCQ